VLVGGMGGHFVSLAIKSKLTPAGYYVLRRG